jgi:hypothetical protein
VDARIGFKKDGTKLLEHNNEGTSHVKSMMELKVCFVCLIIIITYYSLWKFGCSHKERHLLLLYIGILIFGLSLVDWAGDN